MNAEQLAQLKQAAMKATPGPWWWGPADPEINEHELDVPTGDDALWGNGHHRILTDGSARAEYSPDIDVCGPDAQYIALANPQTILDLIAEVERLGEGRFTPEEFQNLCHNRIVTDGFEAFADGCEEYQQKLFGRCRTKGEVL